MTTFLAATTTGIQTNPTYTYITDDLGFELSDFLRFVDQLEEDFVSHISDTPKILQENTSTDESSMNSNADDGVDNISHTLQVKCNKKMKRGKLDQGFRIAFRMKTELEIMDDGYKWRKYGKKMVKNNPNPRNYCKCSSQGCNVKKRVERDIKDSSYVITTYEGVHNHETPSLMYYNNQMQLTECPSQAYPYY